MRHNPAPEFPTRRPARPLTLASAALVMIFVIIALITLLLIFSAWPAA